MAEENYHGVPRRKIPWSPMINYEKCISCGKCVEYCHMGVFKFEEKKGKKSTVVKNPNSCVMFCTGCDSICPAGAIKHPSKMETREKIRQLKEKRTDLTKRRALQAEK